MINKQIHWYHYIMLPFWAQVLIVFASMIICLVQFVFYAGLDETIVLYDDVCEFVIDDTNGKAQCGETTVALQDILSEYYLIERLTTGREPTIMCANTTTKYLNENRWTCKILKEEDDNAENVH